MCILLQAYIVVAGKTWRMGVFGQLSAHDKLASEVGENHSNTWEK